jgi:hypothetical protein
MQHASDSARPGAEIEIPIWFAADMRLHARCFTQKLRLHATASPPRVIAPDTVVSYGIGTWSGADRTRTWPMPEGVYLSTSPDNRLHHLSIEFMAEGSVAVLDCELATDDIPAVLVVGESVAVVRERSDGVVRFCVTFGGRTPARWVRHPLQPIWIACDQGGRLAQLVGEHEAPPQRDMPISFDTHRTNEVSLSDHHFQWTAGPGDVPVPSRHGDNETTSDGHGQLHSRSDGTSLRIHTRLGGHDTVEVPPMSDEADHIDTRMRVPASPVVTVDAAERAAAVDFTLGQAAWPTGVGRCRRTGRARATGSRRCDGPRTTRTPSHAAVDGRSLRPPGALRRAAPSRARARYRRGAAYVADAGVRARVVLGRTGLHGAHHTRL